ncbi:hypothetical protein PENANT_c017G11266 [Penicillium antarcticum]|uniref:Wax synthase domain-containing protein n=1 Tax=Penicillium antarcticum TaxID=416450 RepID=A0A1V6Q237_9EURO|nr:uncharacterized protein N7508_005478 [Penicillium antarcticum]KAJ5306463.1 hypothetical protein N7508_005478 [Penicillium antarcticum]OQD83285.1 hypothetical protein PENANT_c017G11266 [Penicillium antarcticum]
MYGLYDSTVANILVFGCFYLVQITVPAVILITARKRSLLRYLCIPCMLWAASHFIQPFGASGSPEWCQAITQLVIVAMQALNFLLINAMDSQEISCGAKSNQRFGSRFVMAIRLLGQTRAINTPWQVKNVPSHPQYYIRRGMPVLRRGRFLLRQFVIAVWQYLVLDLVQTTSQQQAMDKVPEESMKSIQWIVPAGQWVERIGTHISIWFIVNRLIGDLPYRVLSIIFVGTGLDSPSDWPPAWGRMGDAYTLRNFWGKFWHQFMRRPFTSISNFVSRDVLNLTRSSLLERYTNIFIVFLISAAFHIIVDILQSISMEKSGSMPFYLAFILGIMLEDGVQELWKHIQYKNEPNTKAKSSPKEDVPFWKRSIGLVWVMLWLGVTSTWYFTPMIQSTTEDVRMVPVSAARYIGLGPLIGIVVTSGAIITYTFEIEI